MSPLFKYHARDEKGVDKDGTIEAWDETGAVKTLQEQGLVVVSIEMTGTGKPGIVISKGNKAVYLQKFLSSIDRSVIITIILIIIVVFFIFKYYVYTGVGTQSSSSSSTSIGSEASLYVSGSDLVIIAVDEKAFNEVISAKAAGDARGLAELVYADRAFTVPNNTRVRVINRGMFSRKVRIIGGGKDGRSGWVPYEWVR